MPGNNRVFISHSHDDNARCAPLLAAMDAWGVDYWFDTEGGLSAGQHLTERVQQAMAVRDVFLRICTGATQRSFWMSLETNAFRGLIAEDLRSKSRSNRVLINLILDGDYSREPFDNATLFIDAASRPRQVWMGDLARALGVSTAAGQTKVSRRALLGYGAAAAVTLSSTAAAGALYLDYRGRASAVASTHAPGKVVWQLDGIGFKKDIPALPSVDGDTLYVMTGVDLSARPLSDPKHVLWHKQFNPKSEYSSASVAGDTAYVSVDYTVYAFKASDGSRRWTADLPKSDSGDVGSSPLVVGDAVYVLSTKGNLYAFSAKDGSPRWNRPIEEIDSVDQLFSALASDGESIYVGSLDHNVYALQAKDGSPKWKFLTRGQVISNPLVANGVVYIGSSDNYVYALNAHDGSLKWKYQTGNDVQSNPNVVDGVVFIASNDRYLYALDADSGTPYWRAPVGDLDKSTNLVLNGGNVFCQPAVTPDGVAIVDDSHHIVRCYNRRDGALRWKYDPGADAYHTANPVAANGLILFGSSDQNLYAFGA